MGGFVLSLSVSLSLFVFNINGWGMLVLAVGFQLGKKGLVGQLVVEERETERKRGK